MAAVCAAAFEPDTAVVLERKLSARLCRTLWTDQYRLCKKGQLMNEECFQRGALAFFDNVTTIRYVDNSAPAFTIPAVDVSGEGIVLPKHSTWRRDPIPACACDSGLNCRHASSGRGMDYAWLKAFFVPYTNNTDGPPGCMHGTMFEPPWPTGYGHIAERVDTGGKRSPKFNYEMVDRVRVPSEAGEYLLSWRWDTEQKSQVWSSCADVVVA